MVACIINSPECWTVHYTIHYSEIYFTTFLQHSETNHTEIGENGKKRLVSSTKTS